MSPDTKNSLEVMFWELEKRLSALERKTEVCSQCALTTCHDVIYDAINKTNERIEKLEQANQADICEIEQRVHDLEQKSPPAPKAEESALVKLIQSIRTDTYCVPRLTDEFHAEQIKELVKKEIDDNCTAGRSFAGDVTYYKGQVEDVIDKL